jgi:hypothetical protein
MYRPLIEATNGSTFLHLHFAVVILSIYVLSFLRWRNGFSWVHAVLIGLSSFALLAVWEAAAYILALFSIIYALWPGTDLTKKRVLLTLQLTAFLAASYSLPHMSVHRFAFSLPAACIYSSTVYMFLINVLPLRGRTSLSGLFYVIAGTLFLAVLMKPLRAGGLAPFPALDYFYYRLRHIFAKPSDPLLLPDAVRFVWTSANAAPSRYSIFQAFFPLVFFLPPVLLAASSLKKNDQSDTERAAGESLSTTKNIVPVRTVSFVTLISVVLYAANQGMLALAMPAIFPLLGLPMLGIRKHLLSRGLLIVIGVVLIASQAIPTSGKHGLVQRAALRMNFSPESSNEFVRISFGDADQNLVRFLLRRTSVRDPILAPPNISSVLATFAGRTTLLAPGIETRAMIEKTVSFVGNYYQTESDCFAACRAAGIEYVIYSADFVLDGSSFSPLYLAGKSKMLPSSVAYKMHFFPEMLSHFTLTYENDNYRLFKLSDEIRPIFSTDHPPIYQYEILDLNGDSLEQFYKRILNLVFLYGSGLDEQAKGNHEVALDIFTRCIGQAPHYTAARLGQAAALSNLGDVAAAKNAYEAIISYAPDTPEALYGLALSLGRSGDTSHAKKYVDILLSSTGDEDMIKKAKLLKWFLEENIPIDSPDSLQTGTP